MPKLTQKQADTLTYIKDFIKKNGFGPTRAETADNFDIMPNAAQDRIMALIRKGAVKQEADKMRSIRPIKGFRVLIK